MDAEAGFGRWPMMGTAPRGYHRDGMEDRRLDWSSAEVSGGQLTVPLSGEGSKEWAKQFGWVAERLQGNSADWGEVRASKRSVKVAGVAPGSEPDVRHFLESVLAQVNADHAEPDRAGPEEDGGGPDAEMTATFRSFAEPEDSQAP